MIITGAWTTVFAVLAGLGTGDPWTAVAAIFLAAMLIVTAGDRELREFALLLYGLLISVFRRRPAPVLPGPGKPQASRKPDEDTGILAAVDVGAPKLTESELAYLDWLHGLWKEAGE